MYIHTNLNRMIAGKYTILQFICALAHFMLNLVLTAIFLLHSFVDYVQEIKNEMFSSSVETLKKRN